ncbi:o-succinylbenzoate--CoA ligase [Alicyclobacillus sp. ALC3]|uniref:o-succinylbenzoate--CoA ligase n=1 Tax=Alicyclobacillus sp. ALC3 TaxID=2796143 RepID=UPI002379F826|nr:o-succinylbenzoate--CoA ligase [Alicyclobacillus sp. ALC3]WDL96830.1 o-succinylbenzoate--CoA ligase [Alicyclobacillus sp. ALC3]
MVELLPDWLARRAVGQSKTVAVEEDGASITYSELQTRALRLAGELTRLGLCKGDRVGVFVIRGLAFAVAVHALMQVGAVLVPLNRRLTAAELAWQLNDADVHLLLSDLAAREAATAVFDASRDVGLELTLQSVEELESRASIAPWSVRASSHIDLDAVHAVIYTSGTTGYPKGVMITYGNHWWSATASALRLGVHAGDRWLSPMPLFHVGGLAVLMRSLIYGTSAVLLSKFEPKSVNEALDHGDIDLVSLAPTMLAQMLADRRSSYPPRLRTILLGGSSAPLPLLEQCLELGVPVAQSYGLTEANSQVATLDAKDALYKFGSSGRPLLPTEVEIRVNGERVPAGVEGEIVVRGPSVTPGYLNRPDATAAALSGGWLHTGDYGRLDDEGYLYVLDRRNDLVVSGAENVYPAEVESVLLAHDGVADACVVGRPDEMWGQVPVAYVVTRAGTHADEADLIAHCKQKLAHYKVPKDICYVQQLPRNAAGKLVRKTVREWENART